VPDIGTIKRAVREASRFYAKLVRWATPSVTSTSAVDSVSTMTAHAPHSTARPTIPLRIRARHCLQHHGRVRRGKRPHPIIVSESGRAIVALSFRARRRGVRLHRKESAPIASKPAENDEAPARNYRHAKSLTRQNRMESLHDAQGDKEQAQANSTRPARPRTKAKIETVYGRSRGRSSTSARA
jgi:arginine decarboxylase